MYEELKRKEALNRLGGVVCRGLSFIGGPECPIPPDKLTEKDINIGHRISRGLEGRNRRRYSEILGMDDPNKEFILLCALCNQRMRHLCNEFGWKKLPKEEVMNLYQVKKWTLEQIASKFECNYSTVSRFLKNNGIKLIRNQGGRNAWHNTNSRAALLKERRERNITPERIKKAKLMFEFWKDGLSLREVAGFFCTTKGSVRAHFELIGELYD